MPSRRHRRVLYTLRHRYNWTTRYKQSTTRRSWPGRQHTLPPPSRPVCWSTFRRRMACRRPSLFRLCMCRRRMSSICRQGPCSRRCMEERYKQHLTCLLPARSCRPDRQDTLLPPSRQLWWSTFRMRSRCTRPSPSRLCRSQRRMMSTRRLDLCILRYMEDGYKQHLTCLRQANLCRRDSRCTPQPPSRLP